MLSYIIKEKGNLKKAYKMHKAAKKIRALDLFDPDFYLRKYPDVKKSRLSPLDHYLYHGFKESKQPGRLFDNNFYLKNTVMSDSLEKIHWYIMYCMEKEKEENASNPISIMR